MQMAMSSTRFRMTYRRRRDRRGGDDAALIVAAVEPLAGGESGRVEATKRTGFDRGGLDFRLRLGRVLRPVPRRIVSL